MSQNRNQGGDIQQGGGQQGSVPRAGRQGRGFAGMDAARQREIASKGGKAAHEKGTAHEFTSEEARVAGRKGGEVVSQNREHMAMIGREGGQARGHRHRMSHQNEFGSSQDEGNRTRNQDGLSGDESLSREEARIEDEGRGMSEDLGQSRLGDQESR